MIAIFFLLCSSCRRIDQGHPYPRCRYNFCLRVNDTEELTKISYGSCWMRWFNESVARFNNLRDHFFGFQSDFIVCFSSHYYSYVIAVITIFLVWTRVISNVLFVSVCENDKEYHLKTTPFKIAWWTDRIELDNRNRSFAISKITYSKTSRLEKHYNFCFFLNF